MFHYQERIINASVSHPARRLTLKQADKPFQFIFQVLGLLLVFVASLLMCSKCKYLLFVLGVFKGAPVQGF